MSHVADHADNLQFRRSLVRNSSGIGRSGSCPGKPRRRRLVDDRDRQRTAAVVRAEVPSLQKRNPHRRKIIRCAHADIGLVGLGCSPSTLKLARAVAAGKRQPADRADRLHARHRFDSLDHLADKRLSDARDPPMRRSPTLKIERRSAIKAGVDLGQADEALHHQAGTDEQDQRQGNLRRDQGRARRDSFLTNSRVRLRGVNR